MRLAVSLGGGADTQAAIVGAVAEPLFGIPDAIANEVLGRLAPPLREIHDRFRNHVAGADRPRSDPARIPRDLPGGDG